jgi:hypothetical protein
MRLRLVGIAAALASAASIARAQRPSTVVRIQVVDTAGAPLPGAQVSAMRGMVVLASATSDAGGVQRFTLPRGDDEVEIVARKIGYQRGDHFFRADRDSVSLVVTLRVAAQSLPAVQVTAGENLRYKRYHVSADDIAASKRPLLNALDIVMKLRPDMMDPPGPGIFTRCGLRDVWINGQRIVFPPVEPALAIRASQEIRAARSAANRAIGRVPHYTPLSTVPVTVQSALAKIRPEHVEEMKYVDCRDTESTDFAHGQNAVFVVLKPGIGYDMQTGTYVIETAQQAPLHHRLIGVFDETSGEPIADVEIVDLATGSYVKTTVTGTATLAFLPPGNSTVQLRRPGYTGTKLEVSMSPRDTAPITMLLTPVTKPF